MGTLPPLPLTLKLLPVRPNVTAAPVLTPSVRVCETLTVDNPAIGADTVAPEKLIAVIDVPTDDPPCFNSTPEITPVKFAPEIAGSAPVNLLAGIVPSTVKLPVALMFPPTSRVTVGFALAIPTLWLVPSTTNVLVSAISASVTALVIMLRLFFYL